MGDSSWRRGLAALALGALLGSASVAGAGPETAMREFASGQVKKGVRTIGMGGDGATTGNYALVYQDQGGALVDYGLVHFTDTGSELSFTAVGFTSPTFWDDAAFYVIALAQHAADVRLWDLTPASAAKPPSLGEGSNQAVFLKLAKPLTPTLSFGLLASYELSQMTLFPDAGGPPIRYATEWRPSGGAGLHWHPDEHWQVGARVILNHDFETRVDPAGEHGGFLRGYEYRLGAAYSPWKGTLLDVGGTALDRSSGLDGTHTFQLEPNIGAEQVLVPDLLWVRAGYDESTWTAGLSVKFGAFKLDLAGFKDLAAARTGNVFGKSNLSAIGTLNFNYEAVVQRLRSPRPPPVPAAG